MGDEQEALAEALCAAICDLLGEPRILIPGEVEALLGRPEVAAALAADRDARIRREALDEVVEAIEALGSALDRTEANFRAAVAGHPVRGMTENLDENAAARIAVANLRDGGDS